MATTIIMPQGGQDIETGKVVTWMKSEGDQVSKGEIICEVETEKAVFEVEAPADGQLIRIIVGEGEEAPIFSAIGYIGVAGEIIPEEPDPTPIESKQAEKPEQVPPAYLKRKTVGGRPAVSPRARRLADEKNVDIEGITGTGPGGRITEKDVLGILEAQPDIAADSPIATPEHGRIIPMSRIRKVTARKMQQSKQKVPHFYVTLSVDMTEALTFRDEFNSKLKDPENNSISVTDLIIRACVLAFHEHPELNSSVLDDERIVLWEDLNIGLAVAVDSELVAPVMEEIDQQSLEGVARERRRLVSKVKEGKQPSLAPARFTISNLGMFHVDQFLAIINPPETAILAVSSIEKRPSTIDNQTVVLRDMLNLSLSVDHRVADGAIASRFMNAVRIMLEDPARLG
jgi:pyruvate dehydrogenase E2 component (dihydrolipoamide acetyltransferase)